MKKIRNDPDGEKIFVTGNSWEESIYASLNTLRKIPSSSVSHPNIFECQPNAYFVSDWHNFTNSISSTKIADTAEGYSFFVKVQLFSTK